MDHGLDADVLVVGAGPVGLLVAAELALGGVRAQVLERLPEPDLTVKAGSVNMATAEVLDRRGLHPAMREAQRRMVREMARFVQASAAAGPGPSAAAAGPRPWHRQLAAHEREPGDQAGSFPVAGHFAAMMFRPDLTDQQDPALRAHHAAADSVLVPQRDVEEILAAHAAALGVPVRRGVEVTGLEAGDDTVTLQTSAGPLSARWVVGADGGRSTVRKLAGIGFPGTDPEITGYQAIADIDGAQALRPGWTWTPSGVYSYGPIPGRILTVQFTGPPADRSAPVSREEVQASIRLVSGADVTLTALRGTATRWTDNARQAAVYRQGRVLLAGDAAHVHSPFSGQGLNLGVGDASNLGWKLAATVRGWAPEGLLDTYASERHPVSAWVLDWTRAQVALMRGDAKPRQLREIVQRQLLGTAAGMTGIVKLASGIAQRYTLDGAATAAVDTACDDSPAGGAGPASAGRLVGDIELADGTWLADHARHGTFLLLDRTPGHRLGRLTQPWHGRLTVVADAGRAPAGVLVRPDGVVSWAADQAGADAGLMAATLPVSLEAALTRWAGPPAAPGSRERRPR
jgi:2-polyprenyl-6-methoxyphenol hydroxylase-like FAD-dependent oxidoreductase